MNLCLNNIECIFEEYEKWLQNDLENHINESSKDVLKQINNIVSDFEASLNYADYGVENGLHYIKSKNVVVDGFLTMPTFYIFFTKNLKEIGLFGDSECYYDVITDTMYEAVFTYTEKIKTYPNIDYDKFRETMFHELQHAYRHYQILKKEEENKEKLRSEKKIYLDVLSNDIINKLVKYIYYYTNTNEIDAHLTEMYPYLQKHKEITIQNYKNFLNKIPGYEIIEKLKKYQNYFNNQYIENYPKIKEQIGNGFYQIYSKEKYYQVRCNLTPSKCFYMTKDRVNQALLYTEKKFYRILKEIIK